MQEDNENLKFWWVFHFQLQQLLSSSMDKTVRLWDLETKTCLYKFPHSDYGESEMFEPLEHDFNNLFFYF